MPRITLALSLALTLFAAPALAQIGISGSVLPSSPTGFPIPFFPVGDPNFDVDSDGLVDFITTGGNQLDLRFIDPDDPTGMSGGGLGFNAIDVWRGYDTPQNILVGNAGSPGTLTIANGGALRYQHLVLGGVTDDAVPGSLFDVDINSASNFDLTTYLGATAPGQGGSGTLVVTGVGSIYNNAFNEIPADLQAALNLGNGDPINSIVTDLASASTGGTGLFNLTTRERAVGATGGYDVVVGLNGSGRLQIDNGGRVEVQDALMVAVDESSSGDVVVDGFGSQLIAFGRIELTGSNGGQLNLGTDVSSSTEATSFIGGRGRGTLSVTGGGRADFRNGLAIGTPTGAIEGATNEAVDGSGRGSGRVEVSGSGSVLNAFSSALGMDFAFGDGDGSLVELALAVGDIRAGGLNSTFDPTDPMSADANLQTGEFRIADGATVNVLAAEYGGTNPDASNALIGKNGSVTLADGALLVGDELLVDGDLSGYGTVQAGTLDTSSFSVISGGNPNSDNPALAQPLRLVLNDVKQRNNPGGGTTDDSLINRGLIDGVVDITSTGRLLNEGDISVSGEINTGSLTTTVASTLVGAGNGAAPLRIRVSGADVTGSGTGTGPVAITRADELAGNIAFQNNGLLDGEVDVIVTGAFFNGTDQTTVAPSMTSGLSNGGVIRASGSIRAGVFLNHRLGVIEVGQGETLAILADGQNPGGSGPATFAGAILEDGIDSRPPGAMGSTQDGVPEDAAFSAANLGTINVIGGTLDTGVIVDDRGGIADGFIDHVRLFRNARAFNSMEDDETVGTITANDAQINFREGVYNTGVIAFTGGSNTITGRVFNAGTLVDVDNTPMDPTDDVLGINYGSGLGVDAFVRPGVIVVSGAGTTATFADTVVNNGVISIGPFDNVVNFLGDLVNNGTIDVSIDAATGAENSAFLVVAGEVTINGGTFALNPVGSLLAAPLQAGFGVDVIDAASLTVDSFFTSLELPTLGDGLFWDIVYDEANGDVRAEVISSLATGADFTGDGVVDLFDLEVWTANAGILSGASTIQGDADLDGDVDLDDFGLLQQQLLTGVPVAAIPPGSSLVPEPSAALLLVLAGCGAAVRRR